MNSRSAYDVAILAGGLGTRIAGVLGDVPKILAPVNGLPFLEHLIVWLRSSGAAGLTLCLGHLADKVENYIRQRPDNGVNIQTVIEDAPLGTAGALRLARPKLVSDPVLIMNGDTWVDADLESFLDHHHNNGNGISILVAHVDDCSRYGSVILNEQGFISEFKKKTTTKPGPGLISAGIYLFSQEALDELCASSGPSLEKDFLERQSPGAIAAFVQPGVTFIDIGTPESLGDAANIIPSGHTP